MSNWMNAKIGAHRELVAAAAVAMLIAAAALTMPGEAIASTGSDTDSATLVGRGLWSAMVGDAMEPAIPRGALMLSDIADPGDVRVGDIVTVQLSGGLMTRRVVGSNDIDAGRLITLQADASATPESVGVLFTDRAAVVRAYVPLAGYAAELGARAGRILLGVALLVVALALREYIRRPQPSRSPEVAPRLAL